MLFLKHLKLFLTDIFYFNPISICDRQELLHDETYYTGLRHKRVRGQKYDDFIEEFVVAVNQRYDNLPLSI